MTSHNMSYVNICILYSTVPELHKAQCWKYNNWTLQLQAANGRQGDLAHIITRIVI